MKTRKQILESVIMLDKPVSELERDILNIDQAWLGSPLLVLRRQDIISILKRYLTGVISAQDVHIWAWLLCDREDIDYEKGYAKIIDDIMQLLDELNPKIDLALTPEKARILIYQLQTASFDPNEG